MKQPPILLHLLLAILAWRSTSGQAPVESFYKNYARDTQITMKDGFGAEMILVGDKRFFANWSDVAGRARSRIETVHRKQNFYIAILIKDPGADSDGNSMVTYDLKIKSPDGKTYYDETDIPAWKKETPPLHTMQLAAGVPTISIDPWDKLGKYSVDVVVHDRVRHIDIPLEAIFTAVDAANAAPGDAKPDGVPLPLTP